MTLSWIRKLLIRQSRTIRRPSRITKLPAGLRPTLESLEDRTLMTFGAPLQAFINGGANLTPVAGADFNGDGQADLVLKSSVTGQISVALGNGDNTFQSPIALTAPANPTQVLIADINGDGVADLLLTAPLVDAITGATTTQLSISLGNGDGSFQAPINTNLGASILGVTTGDFNNDGKLDLFAMTSVAGPFQNSTVDLTFLGNGDGTFGNPVGAGAIVNGVGANVTVGDFNGDGRLDVAIGDAPTIAPDSSISYTATTLLGNGDGSFQLPVDHTLDTIKFGSLPGKRAPFVTAADLNGDGISDLVVTLNFDTPVLVGIIAPGGAGHGPRFPFITTAPQTSIVDVLQGSPSGLEAPVTYDPGVGSGLTQVVDVNHDGHPDLVIQSNGIPASDTVPSPSVTFEPQTSGGVTILLNKGDGTFGAPVSYVVPVSGPLVAADFNSDGNVDLYIANNTILLGNGDGSFQGISSSLAGMGADAQAVADFNGDGKPDVAVSNLLDGTVSVFLGLGNGTFQDPTVYPVGTVAGLGNGPRGVATGDFNGDGKQDIALAVLGAPGEVSILLGNGDGTFQKPIFSAGGAGEGVNITTADFNGDGITDMLVTDPLAKAVFVVEGGTFDIVAGFSAGEEPSAVVGDFNGDGMPDIATNTTVYLNKGGFNFVPVSTLSLGYGAKEAMATGDFNGDGKVDIAVHIQSGDVQIDAATPVLSGGAISILLGNGDGTFAAGVLATPEQAFPQFPGGNAVTSVGSSIAVADINGDGILDLVVDNLNSVAVSLGRGDGGFYPQEFFSSTAGVAGPVEIGDFNGDGLPDIAELDTGANHTSYTNPGFEDVVLNDGVDNPNQFGAVGFRLSSPTTVTQNTRFSVTVTAVDAAGNPVPGFLGTVYLFADQGMAIPYTFTAADAGTHTFTNELAFTTGSNMVSAGAPGMTVGSQAVTALPGHLKLIVSPTITAGTNNTLTIQALDAFGNPLPTFTGLLSITSSDPKARPISNFMNAAEAGVVTLSANVNGLTLLTDGAQTISVSAQFMTTAVDSVVVSPGHFVVSEPATTIAGAPFALTVSAVDAAGNPIPAFIGTISVHSSDPLVPAIAYTFTAADAGTHTFSASSFTAGSETITVSSLPALPQNMTNGTGTIIVSPAATTAFILVAPVSVIIGDPPFRLAATAFTGGTFFFTLTAVDAFGNVTPNYSGTVAFQASTPRGSLPANYTFTASDAGSHTFNAILDVSNLQTLTAQDTLAPQITGSATFQVNPSPVTSFTVSAPPQTVTAGDNINVVIDAFDIFGNPTSLDAGNIHVTSSDPQAVLPPDTPLSAQLGIALSLRTAGTESFTISDSVLPYVTVTESVNVVAAATRSLVVAGFPATTAGVAQGFTVTSEDAFGNVTPNYVGTVSFSSSDAQASLPASYTFTSADAGTHTFMGALTTAGTQSLSVTDAANHAIAGSESAIAVAPAAATSFVITGFPTTVAGVAHPIVVTAKDAFGNVSVGYTGTVAFSSSDVQAGLPAAYTFTAADAGVRTFYVALKTVGTQSVTVTDSANATITSTFAGIFVTPAATATFALISSSAKAGVAQSLTVEALDAFGNLTPNYEGDVSFSSSDVQAGLPPSYDFTTQPSTLVVRGTPVVTPADLGIHTFTITLKTAGVQSVTITDFRNAAIIGTGSITVSPAAAASFVVSGFSATTAGVAQSFSVVARDAFGNVAIGYLGSVTFRSSDAQASLPAAYTFTGTDAGVHIFTGTLKTAGTQSITATDATTATIVGSQSGIAVTSAAAAGSLSVTGFPATTAGAAKTFTVTVKDAFGNLDSAYSGTVIFSSSDVQAGLPASYTFTAADAGVHTFSATLKTAGTQSITVKDSVTATVAGTQTGIAVAAGVATHLALSVAATATSGQSFSVTVTALDAFGNVATGYTGKIHFADTASSAGLQGDYTFSNKDNGIHVFSITLNTLGLQTLSVTDTANNALFVSALINVLAKSSGGGGGH